MIYVLSLSYSDFTSDRVKAHPRVLKYYRRLEETLDSEIQNLQDLGASTSEVTPFKDVHNITSSYESSQLDCSASQYSFQTPDSSSNISDIASPNDIGFKSPRHRRNSRLPRASRRQSKETANKMPNQSKINLQAFFGRGSQKRKHPMKNFLGDSLSNGTKLFKSSDEEETAVSKPSSPSCSQPKMTTYFSPTAKVVDQSSAEPFVNEDVVVID